MMVVGDPVRKTPAIISLRILADSFRFLLLLLCALVCVFVCIFSAAAHRGMEHLRFPAVQSRPPPSPPLCTPTSKVRGIKGKQGSSFPSASAPAAAPNERESECVSPEVAWKRGGDS